MEIFGGLISVSAPWIRFILVIISYLFALVSPFFDPKAPAELLVKQACSKPFGYIIATPESSVMSTMLYLFLYLVRSNPVTQNTSSSNSDLIGMMIPIWDGWLNHQSKTCVHTWKTTGWLVDSWPTSGFISVLRKGYDLLVHWRSY